MATLTTTATLNGVTDFSLFGDHFVWGGDRNISSVDTWGGDGPDTKVFNLTFASDWGIQMLRIVGAFAQTNITDTNDTGMRDIEVLRLGGIKADVVLTTTNVSVLRYGGEGNVNLSLGANRVDTIRLGGPGNHTILGGIGSIKSISTDGGNDTVVLQGAAEQISLGSGNNTITTGAGFVGSITMFSHDADVNTITVGTGGVRSIGVSDGRDTVTVQTGAFVEQMNLGSNNDNLTMQGNSTANQVNMGNGTNTVSVGAGHITALSGYEGNDTVTVTSGDIETLFLGNGANRLTVTSGFVSSVKAIDGIDIVSLGSGTIQQLILQGGNNRVTLGSGKIESLTTNEGNDTVSIGSGRINQLNLGGGNNTLTIGVNGKVGSATFYEGNNTITLAAGAQIDQMIAGGGAGINTVTLNGNSRILTLKMDGSNEAFATNTVTTGTGNIESFYSYKGNNTLNIGTGGIQQIVLSGAAGLQTVTADGWIGSLQCYQSAINLTTKAGGATFVYASGLDDTITTGTGRVNFIGTFGGNDTVNMGTGGIGFAELRDGDDLIRLNASNPAYSNNITGGNGIDTADFSQFAVGVTFSLAVPGALQNVGGLATIGLSEFENLTGTALNDVLTGSDVGNAIRGGLGADTLVGLAGVDLLIGGAGNDSLTGGADADTFQFSPGGGRDRIADFVAGVDLIEFTAATSLANISFTKFGTGVLVKVGTAEVVVENTTVAVMNDVDNFLF